MFRPNCWHTNRLFHSTTRFITLVTMCIEWQSGSLGRGVLRFISVLRFCQIQFSSRPGWMLSSLHQMLILFLANSSSTKRTRTVCSSVLANVKLDSRRNKSTWMPRRTHTRDETRKKKEKNREPNRCNMIVHVPNEHTKQRYK